VSVCKILVIDPFILCTFLCKLSVFLISAVNAHNQCWPVGCNVMYTSYMHIYCLTSSIVSLSVVCCFWFSV